MENYINPTAEGQADPFSEWNRQEGEDDLPNSVTALAPDGSKPITGPEGDRQGTTQGSGIL